MITDMQYLIQFGVRACEREQFRTLLSQVAEHGGLSLSEAANLTHAMTQRKGSESDFASEAVSSDSMEIAESGKTTGKTIGDS